MRDSVSRRTSESLNRSKLRTRLLSPRAKLESGIVRLHRHCAISQPKTFCRSVDSRFRPRRTPCPTTKTEPLVC